MATKRVDETYDMVKQLESSRLPFLYDNQREENTPRSKSFSIRRDTSSRTPLMNSGSKGPLIVIDLPGGIGTGSVQLTVGRGPSNENCEADAPALAVIAVPR